MKIDALAFSAHPDDADMSCGGLLLKLKDMGYHTGIIDLTRGELSTNGNLKTRAEETKKASDFLKLDLRENLKLEDSNIINDVESRIKVINIIRKYKPDLAMVPYFKDRHPDHENAYKLLKDSIFIAGLEKFKTGFKKHRPNIVIHYMLHYQFEPSFIVDISDYFSQKIKAVKAYKSQIYSEFEKNAETHISSKYFLDALHSRDKCYGLKIMVQYGEPYYIEKAIKVNDPINFFNYVYF
ncbi:MAG: bacillithiol biosynthesis deacetylase BshB1 [Actinomycetota bacterium]